MHRLGPVRVVAFRDEDLRFFGELAGISIDAIVSCGEPSFRENILFTHRGISGPAILQVSSYWEEDSNIILNVIPDQEFEGILLEQTDNKKEL